MLPPKIVTTDYHRGGEPFRIVADPPVPIPGRTVWALNETALAVHPTDPRLDGVYGTIWFDDLGDEDGHVHQRNVTIFADGEVDRSPCGSGTCARLAVLAADERLPAGAVLRHDSIVGSLVSSC